VNLPHDATSALGLARVQGALVALPRPGALRPLGRVRSPAWAAVLPGFILVGTFGPLAAPSTARWFPVLAAMATPPMAAVAAVVVIRGRGRWPLAVALAATVLAFLARGSAGYLSGTVVTGLACLALGAALARVIPARWMLAGVASMAIADVVLLACGAGQPAAALIADASASHRVVFEGARIGRLELDYPDLLIAATLGAFLADQRDQRRGAAFVTALAACCFLLTPAGTIWPATVPVAVTLVALRAPRWLRSRSRLRRGARSPDPEPGGWSKRTDDCAREPGKRAAGRPRLSNPPPDANRA
jgi:hypothetical protein